MGHVWTVIRNCLIATSSEVRIYTALQEGRQFTVTVNPSRYYLTDEHRMQFVTHAAALESGWSPIQFLLCVNVDVISEKRYIKAVVVC